MNESFVYLHCADRMNLQPIRKGTPIARPRIFNLLATLKYWRKMQSEIWKDVPGFSGYQVSNAGRVRSLPRTVKRGNHTMNISGSILRFGTSMGYSFVNLRKDGKSVSVKVHKLVGLVFVENPKNRPEIDHINTDRKDNRPENLRWVNRHENNMNPITRERMSKVKRKIK